MQVGEMLQAKAKEERDALLDSSRLSAAVRHDTSFVCSLLRTFA